LREGFPGGCSSRSCRASHRIAEVLSGLSTRLRDRPVQQQDRGVQERPARPGSQRVHISGKKIVCVDGTAPARSFSAGAIYAAFFARTLRQASSAKEQKSRPQSSHRSCSISSRPVATTSTSSRRNTWCHKFSKRW